VTLRTLRTWKRLDPAQPAAAPGRPALTETALDEARAAVREQLELQGHDAGEGPVHRALGGRIPLARVRRVLRELKAARRKRRREHREAARVSVTVVARDAVWSMDSTHLGRDMIGHAVQAEVVREVASTRTIGITVGAQATDEEVVTLLEQVAVERSGFPLVLLTDNGGAYVSDAVEAWCRRHRVLHLLSLPRTPQHNGASEHGMRELKHDAALGKGTLVLDMREARALLEASRHRIDRHRLRRTRGWRTAVQADRGMPHWSALVSREDLWERATCEISRALLHCQGERARRRATRAAIYATLAHFFVITRTRGGRPWTAPSAERVS